MRPGAVYSASLVLLLISGLPALSQENLSARIERPRLPESVFHSILPGMSQRWWRNFRNPSFCCFVLCNGSCADIFGKPRIGFYSWDGLYNTTTPCSLDDLNISAGSCCMSRNSCSDDACDKPIELCD